MLTQFGQFPDFEYVTVELVIVDDREDHLVDPLQLLYVVDCYVAELRDTPLE